MKLKYLIAITVPIKVEALFVSFSSRETPKSPSLRVPFFMNIFLE